LQQLAQRDGISIDQFIATSVAEKIAALLTAEHLEARARRGDRAAYDTVLAKVPDIEPEAYDKLPVSPEKSQ
jgi:hypothetical protein